MESGKDQSYWPGFVDALSNVVLTLVFVLVVFVFALVMASNKVQQKVQEIAAVAEERREQKIEAEKEMQDLRQELRETLSRLQQVESLNVQLKKQMEELKREQVAGSAERNALKEKVEIKVEAPPAKTEGSDAADVDRNVGVIVITFPRGVFELSDKARQALDRALEPQLAQLAGLNASVKSVMGAETYSEGKRLAYFRGLTVRNYLIDKKLGSGRTVNVVIEQSKDVGDGRVEIRFRR